MGTANAKGTRESKQGHTHGMMNESEMQAGSVLNLDNEIWATTCPTNPSTTRPNKKEKFVLIRAQTHEVSFTIFCHKKLVLFSLSNVKSMTMLY